jgi:uracil-DNA glycosylase
VSALAGLVEKGLVAPDWAEALAPVDGQIAQMGRFLREEIAAGRGYLPAGQHILRAFTRPLSQVKVLIVGQDPYPTPGHPVGLSFSVAPGVAPPRSLVNIFAELVSDQGAPAPTSGDLTPWADAGVMLLNRSLTVQPGRPASHRGRGWEPVTDQAIRTLAARARQGAPLTAILWGRDAQSLKGELTPIPWVESVHPSPLSAHRGFLGSRPFGRVNRMLEEQGGTPVDWHLP